ncbi:MAG: SGNH/GDSL hydrolase family protein, partial [Bacteroidetes bacterium]|nr:SGNH/GDSL hydrolase family protein [Bacteroidota bacterium]
MRFTLPFLFIILYSVSLYSQSSPCVTNTGYHIVVLGSSTAAGAGASPSDSAWVNRYRSYLQGFNPDYQVTNRAQGGFNSYRIMPTGFTPPSGRPNADTIRNIT